MSRHDEPAGQAPERGSAGFGTFTWHLREGHLTLDDHLIELFALEQGAFGSWSDALAERAHPLDHTRVHADLRRAVDSCGSCFTEYRIVGPDGRTRWVGTTGRVLSDEHGTPVTMLGTVWAVTDHRDGDARVQQVLESMSTAFFSLDTAWRFTYVNARAEALFGRSRDQMLGVAAWDLFPAAVGSNFEEQYRHVMSTGESVSFDACYPPAGTWYEVRAWRDPDGITVYFLDITARHAAQVAAERAAARSALLAQVAAELAETLDAEAVLAHLPRLVVPALGEWCISTVADPGAQDWRGRVRDIGSWHADPALRDLTDDYRQHRIDSLASRSAVTGALELSGPVVIQHDAQALSVSSLDGPATDLLVRLAPESTVALPLRGHGHVLGLLTVSNGRARGPFTDLDLASLGEIAAQVGLALDNARLQAAARDLATELQASLLTALPEPEDSQLTARYLPAARGIHIGGDWYDAFAVGDGSTSLVIGDVAGHDRAAAVVMAQVRNVLRGVAYALMGPPAAALTALDRAMSDPAMGAVTTAILAQVERPGGDALGSRTLRWSNAGHPPPLLIHPDGRTQLLAHAPDLLLGVDLETTRHDHSQVLEPGATVLLYSDGLVERRGEDLDTGLERLLRTAAELGALDLDALCDGLLATLAVDAEDDVALLALRTLPREGAR